MSVELNEILFLENAIWEEEDIVVDSFTLNEDRHVLGVIFRNASTGEKVSCTFKPHGIIKNDR